MVYERFFNRAKRFMLRNARPLDFARWKFHFENGSAEEALSILAAYQNSDGGFGSALEPDCWNPRSTPSSTLAAVRIIRELDCSDSQNPVVQGILDYLASGQDMADEMWLYSVPSNNHYPHAAWWECNGEGKPSENPTASLAGFMLRFAEKDSALYRRAQGIAVRSVCHFLAEQPHDRQVLKCYLELLTDCERNEKFRYVDLKLFRKKLGRAIAEAVTCGQGTDGNPCNPSFFYNRQGRILEIAGEEHCAEGAEELLRSQLPDGSLPLAGEWWTDDKEAEIACNWQKASALIEALLFLRALK